MTRALIALVVVGAGVLHRLAHGGLLRKVWAHVLAGVLAGGLVAVGVLVGGVTWPQAVVVAGAAWVQWVSPTRDFASSRSLLEAHLPWASVAAVALWSPLPLLGPVMVVAGYWAFQRWWPSTTGFWKPTNCAEAWAGAWVWGSSAGALLAGGYLRCAAL